MENRNYFKFSPGASAKEWDRFYDEKIAAVDFNLGDLNNYMTRQELNTAAGQPAQSPKNDTYNLWLFKTANIGDVVFANKGVNTCIGIGIIESNYYYDNKVNEYKHRRKINWITKKDYEYKADKTLFRPDTFTLTTFWNLILNESARIYPELIPVFEENKLKYNSQTKGVKQEESEESREINYWWLNANPKTWEISKYNEGQKQTYTTHNENGNKRRIYKYFEEIKPGDLMIGYESTPTRQIKAIFEATRGLYKTANSEEIEFQMTEKLENPVHWNDISNNPALQNSLVFINNQGSLFSLKKEEFEIIRDIIDDKNINTKKNDDVKLYRFNEDADKPFLSEQYFLQAVNLLERKKNIILQGPPGVGKTFIARKLAYEIMHKVKDTDIEMVQFHQSYSYEDFVQGLRPTLKGGFELRDGIFYTFCQKALAHPKRQFFFIIDEINRGNLSKIFGELMMLLEVDKRDKRFALKLTYAKDESSKFFVPENLYIIGTMNTADRSLAIVDYALRRRFAFINLQPDYGDTFREFLLLNGISNDLIEHICTSVTKVNSKICEDNNLGNGFQIGHSYFCSFNKGENESEWWNEILIFEIKPLLEEIWFDDLTKVEDIMQMLSR